MANSKIGALLGANDVEDAVIATLQAWLPSYLYEVEQDHGLPDKSLRDSGAGASEPGTIRGGIDFELWQEDQNPTVIVVVKPFGSPERRASVGIGQTYDVQVCVVVSDEDEDSTRRRAAHFGVAVMGSLVQQADLGGTLADLVETRLHADPDTSFRNPDDRRLVQCVSGYHVFVQPIVSDLLGLDVPSPPAPPFGDWPTVKTTSVTVTGQPIQ